MGGCLSYNPLIAGGVFMLSDILFRFLDKNFAQGNNQDQGTNLILMGMVNLMGLLELMHLQQGGSVVTGRGQPGLSVTDLLGQLAGQGDESANPADLLRSLGGGKSGGLDVGQLMGMLNNFMGKMPSSSASTGANVKTGSTETGTEKKEKQSGR